MLKKILALILIIVAYSPALNAQQPNSARLRLFLDCATHCDREYFRTEITEVDWVTDKEASDVYVLATSQQTGAGGSEVVLEFIGHGSLEGMTDRHTFTTAPDASSDDFRTEFVRVLKLGLVRYLLQSGHGVGISLLSVTDGEAVDPSVLAVDPWNFWVFEIQLDGEINAESRRTGSEFNLELNADRITENWKLRFQSSGTIDRTKFDLEDGSTFTAKRDRWRAEGLVARSLSPHWSVGVDGDIRGSKPDNLTLRARVAPAIEYDVFPYSEISRRRLILQYTLGFNRYDYEEVTIFNKLEETRLDHRFRAEYRVRQPWGEAHLNGAFEAFANDLSSNRVSFSTGLDIRVAKGLSFEVDANYSRVRNQLAIPKGDASDEEVFLELRELQTDYEAGIQMGLSYTFGSFLNSVVNPRFDNLD